MCNFHLEHWPTPKIGREGLPKSWTHYLLGWVQVVGIFGVAFLSAKELGLTVTYFVTQRRNWIEIGMSV
jgi:hypothetical protein